MMIEGKYINMRIAQLDDAEFLVKLRNHPERSRFLHEVPDDVNLQKSWLRNYKIREEAGEDYYFIIEGKDKTPYGAIRLHDMVGNKFTWGSWILLPNAPKKAAIDTLVNLYEYAFKKGFKESHFFVRKDNLHAIAFYDRFGALRDSKDNKHLYYILNIDHYKSIRNRYLEFLGEK